MLSIAVGRQVVSGIRHRRPLRGGVRILVYHGVVERRADEQIEHSFHLLAQFREHLAFLRRYCHVVPLDDLDAAIAERTLRPRVAITFDDGFANNLLAGELLVEHQLPATVFVATENVERGETVWPTLLRLVLARGSVRTLELAGTRYQLDDPGAFAAIRSLFKELPSDARRARWAELVAKLRPGELGELQARFPSLAMMSWAQVRTLASSGIAIGSHGRWHELHHAAQPATVRLDELAGSRTRIEAELGQPCRDFAFPNGTFHDGSTDEVAAAGYLRGFTMVSGTLTPRTRPQLVPRLGAQGPLDKFIGTLIFGS